MIRRLVPGDEALLRQLCERYKDRVPSEDDGRRLLEDTSVHVFAAVDDGEVVGFSYCHVLRRVDGATSVFLYELEVAEGHRRRGLGRALVDAARQVAEDVGAVRMWVQTDDDNVAAQRTYESAGASRAGADRHFVWRFTA
jgi:GNAT superfamily N-acetyltransferase